MRLRKLIPDKDFVFETRLSPEQASAVITARTETRLLPRTRKLFEGKKLGANRFVLYPTFWYDTPSTAIDVEILPASHGATVRARMRVPRFHGAVALALFAFVVLSVVVAPVVAGVMHDAQPLGFAFFAVVIAGAFVLCTAAMHSEEKAVAWQRLRDALPPVDPPAKILGYR